jgi:hypothetical protein
MFIDTSVTVELLTNEPDAAIFAECIPARRRGSPPTSSCSGRQCGLSTLFQVDPMLVETQIFARSACVKGSSSDLISHFEVSSPVSVRQSIDAVASR